MRLRGLTHTRDYNLRTLLWFAARPRYWSCGADMRDWKLFEWLYDWYDGPIWQLRVGPLWVCVSAFQERE